jgi:elongator complex protein 1
MVTKSYFCRVTSSTRRKARRKAAGKKGTVDEFEYLLNSLGRLVSRVDEKSGKLLDTRISSQHLD